MIVTETKETPINTKSTTISIPTINAVKEFVNLAMNYEFSTYIKSGRYCIDAKSIMGVFSLDVSKPLELIVDFPIDKENVADAFLNTIKKYKTT